MSLLLGLNLLPWPGLAAQSRDEPVDKPPSLSYGGEVDLNSRYVWRGLASSEGAVMQPSAWGSAAGFTLSSDTMGW